MDHFVIESPEPRWGFRLSASSMDAKREGGEGGGGGRGRPSLRRGTRKSKGRDGDEGGRETANAALAKETLSPPPAKRKKRAGAEPRKEEALAPPAKELGAEVNVDTSNDLDMAKRLSQELNQSTRRNARKSSIVNRVTDMTPSLGVIPTAFVGLELAQRKQPAVPLPDTSPEKMPPIHKSSNERKATRTRKSPEKRSQPIRGATAAAKVEEKRPTGKSPEKKRPTTESRPRLIPPKNLRNRKSEPRTRQSKPTTSRLAGFHGDEAPPRMSLVKQCFGVDADADACQMSTLRSYENDVATMSRLKDSLLKHSGLFDLDSYKYTCTDNERAARDAQTRLLIHYISQCDVSEAAITKSEIIAVLHQLVKSSNPHPNLLVRKDAQDILMAEGTALGSAYEKFMKINNTIQSTLQSQRGEGGTEDVSEG